MIIDKLDNILFYKSMIPNLELGLEAVNKLKTYTEGRYEFEGGYFMVQKGETKPMEEGTFEAHRKYIDIQIVVEGKEEIAWSDISDLETVIPYNEEKDAERLNGDKTHNMVISEGMFYVAFSHDGHKAISHTKQKHSYTKVVMKILL
ncbi:YhcH/YjgK/YiaL family protein [Intestinibacter sp.]